MLHFRLECIHELTVLRENGNVKVVVIVGYKDFTLLVDADACGKYTSMLGDARARQLRNDFSQPTYLYNLVMVMMEAC